MSKHSKISIDEDTAMTAAAKPTLKTKDIKPKIGSEILNSKEELLSGTHAEKIKQLIEERSVLVFRKINLNDEEQAAFAKTLGEIAKTRDAGTDVYPISRNSKLNITADYMPGTFHWHIDGTADEIPGYLSILTGKRIPEEGAATEFANIAAAYNDLPEGEKAEIANLQVWHSIENLMRCAHPEPSYEQLKGWQSLGPKKQPLVWTQPSGRKSLVVGSSASHIEGMDFYASALLLCKLRDWATQPQYTYRHVWEEGDMVMWHNTVTLHRAVPYEAGSIRELHRIGLKGQKTAA